ncbi:unnamed protein product [Rotaria sordida]|uniref:Protoheme IX farnesyltransferase, mitochondrial n=2 Tax=Rotaria sordida TaxID=392033 RepID=A0A818KGJ1_9BILA|nr:unnamed protein product [Rotaria sordida]CAF0761864.1 unnamed protein product [Rotaria sordida]CAF0773806.1 unnamed protein product [Rotaria sordida]CAF3561426.1 unnamed protein product [Rotaria sordida]
MNRLLVSFMVPRYGQIIHTIRIQSIQLFSSNLSRQYSSIIRLPTITSLIYQQRYASVPRPKISQVTNSDEWLTSSTSSTKQNEKTNSSIIDLTKSITSQPFCDPPIKTNDIDSKHTFKETEQELVILPTDLNSNAHISLKQLCDYYTKLSKKNLTILVATTAAYGFAIAPLPINIPLLACVTLGTVLTSASANTINQLMEIPYDAQMKRTRNRVLVLGQISYRHATGFAAVTLISGVTILTLGCNPLTGILGLSNFLLYTCIYTPMKRKHIINTWIGSIVGAIPPVMGWTACTGSIDSGALLLAFLLYAWQFPHFNSLSWNIRQEYDRAGYKMMCVSHERLCLITSLRYSIMILLSCSFVAPLIDMTTWLFAFDTLPINFYLIYLSYKFYRNRDAQSSRKLFRYSLIHLPLLFTLMVIHRQVKTQNHTTTSSRNELIPVPI